MWPPPAAAAAASTTCAMVHAAAAATAATAAAGTRGMQWATDRSRVVARVDAKRAQLGVVEQAHEAVHAVLPPKVRQVHAKVPADGCRAALILVPSACARLLDDLARAVAQPNTAHALAAAHEPAHSDGLAAGRDGRRAPRAAERGSARCARACERSGL